MIKFKKQHNQNFYLIKLLRVAGLCLLKQMAIVSALHLNLVYFAQKNTFLLKMFLYSKGLKYFFGICTFDIQHSDFNTYPTTPTCKMNIFHTMNISATTSVREVTTN